MIVLYHVHTHLMVNFVPHITYNIANEGYGKSNMYYYAPIFELKKYFICEFSFKKMLDVLVPVSVEINII